MRFLLALLLVSLPAGAVQEFEDGSVLLTAEEAKVLVQAHNVMRAEIARLKDAPRGCI